MKCPQCNREMETGFVQWEVRDNLTWVPKLLPLGLSYWKKDSEILYPTGDGIGVNAAPASICRACRKVVMEYGTSK